MEPYERFEAWQRSHACTQSIYAATRKWPVEERYGLSAEIRRAARSMTTNIVEGSAKYGVREFRRYLDISNGSAAEVGYLLLLARDTGILSVDDWMRLEKIWKDAARLILAALQIARFENSTAYPSVMMGMRVPVVSMTC